MIEHSLLLFGVAIVAGFFGSLVGIGGGVIIVPALTLLFGVPIHQAIATSIVSVIATSIAGALSYVDQNITNVRLGMFLEIATTTGALVGAFLAVLLHGWVLSVIFAMLLFYMGFVSLRTRSRDERSIASGEYGKQVADPLSQSLRLEGSYYDQAAKQEVQYHATKALPGSLIASLAGVGSGLLGIGGGVIKVAAMNSLMRIPMKAAVATSKFMIGVTAATSALVFLLAGAIDYVTVAPVALGTMLGATIGSATMNRLSSKFLKTVFAVLMLYLAYQMLAKGIQLGFDIQMPGLI